MRNPDARVVPPPAVQQDAGERGDEKDIRSSPLGPPRHPGHRLDGTCELSTLRSAPCTPHPTPYTLHPTPCILRPTPYTLHRTPYTHHPASYALHPAPCTLHPTPHQGRGLAPSQSNTRRRPSCSAPRRHIHPTPFTLHPSPYTLHPAPYALYPSPYNLHPTPYTTPDEGERTISEQYSPPPELFGSPGALPPSIRVSGAHGKGSEGTVLKTM